MGAVPVAAPMKPRGGNRTASVAGEGSLPALAIGRDEGMRGSHRTGRIVALGALLLLVAACGDDDEAAAADPERFCEVTARLEELDVFAVPPDEARKVVEEVRGLLDEALEVAPDEIRPSTKIVVDALIPALDVFAAADFDQAQIDPELGAAAFEAFLEDEVVAASDAGDDWFAANCSTG